ncbi:MAG TPA: PHP domain-containing protein [Candidatus Limiplasma sp.]|nr:PHP domain-containing protein [Candidatus Limiplasma sp.]
MINEQLVKTEFHFHTAETSPCGVATASESICLFAQKGYGGAIVTDHYLPDMFESMETRSLFLKGYYAAKKAAETLDFTVLPGMEFRFFDADNDFLVYGMEEADFAKLPTGLSRYSLKDFHAYCGDHGWLLFQAHPFRPWCKAQNPAYLDGVEIYNGNIRQLSHNEQAVAFARDNNLLAVAGGDVHQLVDVRDESLRVPRHLLTPKGIVAFLQSRPQINAAYWA